MRKGPCKFKKNSAPRNPFSGCWYNVRNIGPIALATGTHLRKAKNLLIRIPIRKTTNGSSVCAVYLPGITLAMCNSSFHEHTARSSVTLLLYSLGFFCVSVSIVSSHQVNKAWHLRMPYLTVIKE